MIGALKQAFKAGMAGLRSPMFGGSVGAAYNVGRGALKAQIGMHRGANMLGAFAGTTMGRGVLGGAAAGGLYGAMSEDTSILGGAMMGAGLGAAGVRYGMPAAKVFRNMRGAGFGIRSAGRGAASFAAGLAKRDARGVALAANRGYGRVRSSLKGWSQGIAPTM